MIDRTGAVDKALGVHLNKTHKIDGANPDGHSARRDAVTISKFSALVERGRTCAMALPQTRADRVAHAKAVIESGKSPGAGEIASAMINSAVERQV
jgi:hypothetical protein